MKDQRNRRILECVVLFIVIVAILAFLNYFLKDRYIEFSRRVFSGLISGRQSVAKMIDWQKLWAVGVDIGSVYSNISNDKERLSYEKVFINGFSIGFKSTGARFNSFSNWRIQEKDKEKIIVAADYAAKKKVILFTVSKYKSPKLINIRWKE